MRAGHLALTFAAAVLAMLLSVAAVPTAAVAYGLNSPPKGSSSVGPSSGVVATITVNPLRVSLNLSPTIAAGSVGTATETVTNYGKSSLVRVSALLIVPTGIITNPSGKQSLGTLAGGITKHAVWTVRSNEPGRYAIAAQASGKDVSGRVFILDSQPETLTVTSRTKH